MPFFDFFKGSKETAYMNGKQILKIFIACSSE